MIKIKQIFFNNSLRNFSYLIYFNKDLIYCIDPFNASEVLKHLGHDKLAVIINTHDHCDHHSGNLSLVEHSDCIVMGHPNANIPLKSKSLKDHEIIIEFFKEDINWVLKAIHTPGHTLSHLSLLLEKDGVPYACFTGDCFFNAGVGNCHDGNPQVQYQTISSIFQNFPDELLIYPGHEYLKRNLEFTKNIESNNTIASKFLNDISSVNLNEVFFINSMKVEKSINMFLRLENIEIRNRLSLLTSTNETVFIELRSLRDKW